MSVVLNASHCYEKRLVHLRMLQVAFREGARNHLVNAL